MIFFPELASPAARAVVLATEKTCHFPSGHVGDADFSYCGKPSAHPTHYCVEHALKMGGGYARKINPTIACVGVRYGRAA